MKRNSMKEKLENNESVIGASLSLSLGAPIATVSQMLGHANKSITLRIYE